MTWNAGIDRTTGALISAADWNKYLGITGSIMETAPAKVTTAEDSIVGAGANSLKRVAKGSDGQVWTVVAGTLAWATPATPPIANTSSETLLGADVTCVNALTWYDVLSVSLAAGEWLLFAQGMGRNGDATGVVGYWLQLLRVTGTVTLADSFLALPASADMSLGCQGRVVLAGTETIKLQAASNLGSSRLSIRRNSGGPSSPTNVATRLLALKVA